jgi:hypothetical protein
VVVEAVELDVLVVSHPVVVMVAQALSLFAIQLLVNQAETTQWQMVQTQLLLP